MDRTLVLRACLVSCLVFLFSGILWEARATEYYVATNGNDSNPGTIDRPWRTINHAADVMVAGDIVYVRGGTYNEGSAPEWDYPAVNPAHSGTADAPITFKAYPGETVEVQANGAAIGSHARDYIVWDGFTFRRAILYGESPRMEGCVIQNCIVEGTYAPTTDNHDGIRLEHCTVGTIIRDNIVRNTTGDSKNSAGIKLYDNDNVLIEHNDIYGNTVGIFDKSWSIDCTYRRNLIHDNDSLNFYLHTSSGDHTRGTTFYENILYNGSGIYFETDPGTDFANTEIYNNVLPYIHPIYAPNLQIWNNIVSSGYLCREDGTPTYSDYNDFWAGQHFETGVYTEEHEIYDTLGEWQSGTGLDTNSIHQDPDFVNPGNYDFHLDEGSPCAGTGKEGADMGAYPRDDDTVIGPRNGEGEGSPPAGGDKPQIVRVLIKY